MRAARCETYGRPEGLVLRDLPHLVPRPGGAVVAVEAAGVNFPDVLAIADRYQISTPTPFTPGSEFAGRVQAVAPDVDSVRVGDLVMGTVASGAFAEQVGVAATSLRPVPAGLTTVEAAAFHVTYLTAFHAVVTTADVQPGEWVVVLGAGGGVGTATVDLASRLGARVIAAASTEDRLAVCRRLGAEAGIAYEVEDLKAGIRRITGVGADVIVDPVGGRHAELALRATRWGGRFICVGFASGGIPRIPLNLVLLKNVVLRGMELRSLEERLPAAGAHAQRELGRLVATGMKPLVTEVHELANVGYALSRVADRQTTGKIVVCPRPAPGSPID